MQIRRYQGKLIERSLQILDDLSGDHIGGRQVGGVLQAVVLEPENVEAGLVTLYQLFIGERMQTLRLFPLVSVLGFVAGDEVVQVFPARRVRLQREVFVRAPDRPRKEGSRLTEAFAERELADGHTAGCIEVRVIAILHRTTLKRSAADRSSL
jgi:hypothetical protein